MSDTSNPQADYLRALGHADAADALEAADALVPKPEPDVERHEPQRQPTASELAEAERQAEGRVLLAAAKRDIPDAFDR